MNHYRQGDVLLVSVAEVPAGAEDITPRAGPVVLAYGTSTGHSHALPRDGARLLASGDRRLLVLERDTELRHEEHDAIKLPAGVYETRDVNGAGIVQVEYSPEALRTVED